MNPFNIWCFSDQYLVLAEFGLIEHMLLFMLIRQNQVPITCLPGVAAVT